MKDKELDGFHQRLSKCVKRGKRIGISRALKLTPEVAHVVETEIPSVFGEKWQGEMDRVGTSLKEEYGENLGDLLRLAVLLQEYKAVYAASLFECLRGSEVAGTVLEKLCTPDGYIEYEGFSHVFMDVAASTEKPEELLSLTTFDSCPSDTHLFQAMALICFFKAADYWKKDEQEAFGWLYEVSELLSYGKSFEWWRTAEQETIRYTSRERGRKGAMTRHMKAAPLKEIAYKAADENPYKLANRLAIDLEPLILEKAREVGYTLSPYNARNTIAKWIREYKKRTPSS